MGSTWVAYIDLVTLDLGVQALVAAQVTGIQQEGVVACTKYVTWG